MSAADEPPRTDGELTRKRGRPFEAGNPGKPHGAKHRITRAIEKLMGDEAETITRVAIEAAKAGDLTAVKLVLDRCAPPQRDRTVEFDLPKIEGVGDLPTVALAILRAVAAGDLTASEASALSAVLDGYRKNLETSELESRISALEDANAHKA
jgi:hypothetical protein